MCTIDPMHNLLLGTAKHVMETWKKLSVIDNKTLVAIQHKVDSFICPPNIGRIPLRFHLDLQDSLQSSGKTGHFSSRYLL